MTRLQDSRRWPVDALVTIFLWAVAFVAYLWMLTHQPLIYGIDGPYYLTQVSSLLRSGTMVYGDPPFAFYFFAAVAALTGDVTLGVKLGVSVLSTAVVVPSYLLCRRLTGSRVASAFGAAASVASFGLLRMSADLMKNAVGSVFLVLAIYFVYRALQEGGTKTNLVGTIASLLMTAATHVLDFGLSFLFMSLICVFALVLNVDRKRAARFFVTVVSVVGIFSFAGIGLYTRFFSDFGKGISFLEDFLSSLTTVEVTTIRLVDLVNFGLSYVFVGAGLVVSYLEYRKGNRRGVALLAASTLCLVILVFPLTPQQWLWRFSLMTFVPTSIILSRLVSAFRVVGVQVLIGLALLLAIVAEIVPMLPMLRPTVTPVQYMDLERMKPLVPEKSLIIAKMPLAYWAEYVLDGRLIRSYEWSRGSQRIFAYFVAPNHALPPPKPGLSLLHRGRALSLLRAPVRPRTRP